MRQSRAAKAKTHEAITKEAIRLFKGQGIASTGVGEVMAAAQLTHGGFYRHFASKEALVAAAVEGAFEVWLNTLAVMVENAPAEDKLGGFKALYLTEGHTRFPELGCPIAAFATDFAAKAVAAPAEFSQGLDRVIEILAQGFDGTPEAKRRAATRLIANLAGAVILARAAEPSLAREILAAQADA